jgi:hypothetical protein
MPHPSYPHVVTSCLPYMLSGLGRLEGFVL